MTVHKRFVLEIIGIEGIINLIGNSHDGHRHITGGQGFGNGHDIRCNAGMVARKHFARTAKTGGNFIRNKKDAVFIAKST